MLNIFKKKGLKKFCHENNISFLGVFGSFARGENRKNSDLDLIAKFSKRKSLLTLVKLERELSIFFGKKVDLLTEKSISPYLKSFIQKDLKTIHHE